ncbi:PREDICTED: ATP synthase subunit delta, chloroplastic [Ipomoea nil]|uniref:ATP synthase subunit delta, chloroplastic n=1 Tax=Ipomoea nil TaxID=35883 RepID=UPI0009013665|nr:PREDICTED: ATP synthase subunit delta, chloroplastic [Ipomoea nil]
MDTLSNPVSSFTVPTASRRKSVDAYRHFHLLPPRRNSFSYFKSTTATNSEFFTATATVPSNRIPPAKPHPQPPAAAVHRRAASGYAAALVDIAKRNNSLDAVRRDVRRVWKWTRNEQLRAALTDPLVENKEKGEILKEIAEKGKVHKLLGAVLKILAGKNRAELLSEVLMEFERIYDELCGTARVVLLSPANKETAALEVAKTVHQISGAWKVKVSRCCLGVAMGTT